MNHCINGDEGKSEMADTDGVLSERIADLERQLAEKDDFIKGMVEKAASDSLEGYREMGRQLAEKDARIEQLETSNPAWDLMISAQNEVNKWKREVIKWQDTDTENQETIDALSEENERLNKGFGDMTGMLLRGKDD
jgi:hypothetical protein